MCGAPKVRGPCSVERLEHALIRRWE